MTPAPVPAAPAPRGDDVVGRVCRIVADVLGLAPGDVTPDSGPHTITKWDSINHLNVVLAIEREFGVSFMPDEVDHLDRVSAIVRRLQPGPAAGESPETPAGEPAIRRLGPADLDAVVGLLDRRDGRPHSPAAVRSYLCDLDPARLVGWIAEDGEQPVGMTVAYRRRVRWDGRELQAGYWAHLYIAEAHRHRLLYPRLVHAMMVEGRAAGLEMIYTGMRRQAVADAHEGLGFRSVGHLGVRVKPLRPAALLARVWGWSALEALGAPVDRLYARFAATSAPARGAGLRVVSSDTTSSHVPGLLGLLERCAGADVRRLWTEEEWRARFATTLEGGSYRLLLVFAGQALEGGLLLRLAERRSDGGREPVHIGVIMDLVVREGTGPAAPALLAEAERQTLAAGGHAMLWLDGVSALAGRMARHGYRPSAETYRIIVWPPQQLDPTTQQLSRWRFTFAEHDAF
jgi:acyl carrier protein